MYDLIIALIFVIIFLISIIMSNNNTNLYDKMRKYCICLHFFSAAIISKKIWCYASVLNKQYITKNCKYAIIVIIVDSVVINIHYLIF